MKYLFFILTTIFIIGCSQKGISLKEVSITEINKLDSFKINADEFKICDSIISECSKSDSENKIIGSKLFTKLYNLMNPNKITRYNYSIYLAEYLSKQTGYETFSYVNILYDQTHTIPYNYLYLLSDGFNEDKAFNIYQQIKPVATLLGFQYVMFNSKTQYYYSPARNCYNCSGGYDTHQFAGYMIEENKPRPANLDSLLKTELPNNYHSTVVEHKYDSMDNVISKIMDNTKKVFKNQHRY